MQSNNHKILITVTNVTEITDATQIFWPL